MSITNKDIRHFYFLLNKLGLKHKKEEMLLIQSQGRTSSIKELYPNEFTNLMELLKDETTQQLKRRRQKVLVLAEEAGFWKKSYGKRVIDWTRFNHFMEDKSCVKKSLVDCSKHELHKVIAQFAAMVHNNNKSALSQGERLAEELLKELDIPKL